MSGTMADFVVCSSDIFFAGCSLRLVFFERLAFAGVAVTIGLPGDGKSAEKSKLHCKNNKQLLKSQTHIALVG